MGEIKCAYCGRWYIPTNLEVKNRSTVIKNEIGRENRIYCSENCKLSCPTYGRVNWPRGFKAGTSREVNPLIRQMCLKRDDYKCQMCGVNINDSKLHCHHINSYKQNTIMANDIENVITVCKNCHKKIHKKDGCSYYELKC